jgi:uncharacterized protein (TIGR02246 family)
MTFHPVKKLIEDADKAITSEDFDTLMDFYADDAILVIKPGMTASGKDQIRKAFVAIAEYFKHSLVVKQGEMQVLQGGSTALVPMETVVESMDDEGKKTSTTRRATYVFREGSDNQWLCVVDNSYGTDLLGAL